MLCFAEVVYVKKEWGKPVLMMLDINFTKSAPEQWNTEAQVLGWHEDDLKWHPEKRDEYLLQGRPS